MLGLLLRRRLTPSGLLVAAGAGAAGFFLPDLLVYNVGLKRQEELRSGLADALDMLTVCVEAGQGFDAALLQVARTRPARSPASSPACCRRCRSASLAARRSRLGERTTSPEVKTFVSALVQADRLGLPDRRRAARAGQGDALVRRQRAEEKAQKVPVKILFPLLFCIFPALFVVVIGPGAIRSMGTFSGM